MDPRVSHEQFTPSGPSFAPKPTTMTRFLRHFLPWQLCRFVIVNLKMLSMIRRTHT